MIVMCHSCPITIKPVVKLGVNVGRRRMGRGAARRREMLLAAASRARNRSVVAGAARASLRPLPEDHGTGLHQP